MAVVIELDTTVDMSSSMLLAIVAPVHFTTEDFAPLSAKT